MKTKSIILFLSLFLLAGLGELFFYYPAPTYNPFDDVFNVSRERLIKEGCIEDMIECGYFNVTKDFGDGTNMYYQYYEDENIVYAKGFRIDLDTFYNELDFDTYDSIMGDSIQRIKYIQAFYDKKIDVKSLNQRLAKFKMSYVSTFKRRESDYGFSLVLKNNFNNQIDTLSVIPSYDVRLLDHWQSKPKSQKTLLEHIRAIIIYFRNLLELGY